MAQMYFSGQVCLFTVRGDQLDIDGAQGNGLRSVSP